MEKNLLRNLPSVDEILNNPEAAPLVEEYGRDALVNAARTVLDELRSELLKEDARTTAEEISVENIIRRIASYLQRKSTPSLRSAVNATGIILHTGLGRAVLPGKAIDAINDVIKGCCTLATGIETGQRGHRDVHLNDLLCELTGAEAATVVNNNAAATMIILNTLARAKRSLSPADNWLRSAALSACRRSWKQAGPF